MRSRIPNDIRKSIRAISDDLNTLSNKATEKKRLSLREILNGASTVINLILSVVAIVLTYYISEQAQTIKDFDALLRKADTQTVKISKQLEISQDLQERSNQIYHNQKRAAANKLLTAVNEARGVVSDINIVVNKELSIKVRDYFPHLKQIMNGQLENSFLMENSTISRIWVDADINLDKTEIYDKQQYHLNKRLSNREVYDMCVPKLVNCLNTTEKYCNKYLTSSQ